MSEIDDNEEFRKKAIFENMSSKRQKHILNKGYEKWDPFELPKEPIEMRRDKTKRTTQTLVREFLQSRNSEQYSNEYGRGALDICLGIINNNERYIGMFEFVVWYNKLLQEEGHEL